MATEQKSVWNVLFENKQYQELLSKVDNLLSESKAMYKQGYRHDVIEDKQRSKVVQLKNEFKQYASGRLESIKTNIDEIEKESTKVTVTNPQEELIRRQDLEARLSFYDNYELVQYIQNADAKNTSVFELGLLKNVYDNRLSDQEQAQVAQNFEELKRSVLYPYENDDKYQKLIEEYSVIDQVGMANSGVIVVQDNNSVAVKELTDYYNESIKN
ncbi:hypothetical protein [Staphylococcus coagulans]|uniref:hypothetical protein n=1 Tax=Staphylococcus coagulans TaxID=74706 RepID=UPI0015FAEBCE|nr:hypothetical protein [Staphylococcus coagulans]MBA8764180.1 hypothetical protein [Staphylococcus coagulans]MBT2810388.1 hypothetical protein [Staphylococcus coagulans]MBT2811783.1 hypothetical protein [Staphylococcus coagulans]MBT2819106.1 hypothetical protein [Staphylococcus coagulans]MBT2821920.1 hypothetical protein [Staphylococcus coagulans]